MKAGSKTVVIAALVGNLIIAVIKLVVALLTLSSAMLAEAVHSFADTGNQVLLLLGLHRSEKPADAAHPFGYGHEQYFWSFVVANMLFFVGAVVSVYEGIEKLQAPHPIERPVLIYAILGISFLIEAFSLRVAYRELVHSRPSGVSLWRHLKQTKDISVAVVFLEDTAALLGLIIAFAGVGLAHLSGWMLFDALASILIGLLLGVVAFVLAYETKELLIGEAAAPEAVARVRALAARLPEIEGVGEVLTMHLGPRNILVTMTVDFRDTLHGDEIERAIDRLEGQIRKDLPAAGKIFIEAKQLSCGVARRVGPVRPTSSGNT